MVPLNQNTKDIQAVYCVSWGERIKNGFELVFESQWENSP
jgi:hypothetical protein